MSLRSAGIGLLVVSLSAMSAHAQSTPETQPGLEGVVLVSPSRPGPTRKDSPEPGPASNVTFQVKQGDQKVASFTTDGAGHFKLSLPPGHYVIERDDPGARVGHWRFEAHVTPDKPTSVRWTADSGMR